jgi:TonB family protein
VAHIVRGDWFFQLAAELLRAACWFNPVVWMASKRLRHESERACDDVVLSGGVEGGIYARHLLEIARAAAADGRRRHLSAAAPAMVRPGSLERRVGAMLSDTRNRRPAAMRARIATAAGLFGLSVVIAGFAASAQTLATVAGTVRDPHGRGVPGVTLTLIDARRDARQQARTDDQGKFAFAELTPGDYLVEGAMPGFKAARRNVTVTRGDVNLEIALAVGSLSESIHIMAEPGTRSAAGPRSSAARAPRAAIECTPSEKGGAIRPPMKIKNVNPVYPGTPGDNLAGVVVLEGTISTDGRLIDTRVVRSPHDELARAAVDAWEQWEFTPTLLNCVPIEVAVTGTFDFSLRK